MGPEAFAPQTRLTEWFAEVVPMVHDAGYRVTPVYGNGATQPYGNGQNYPDPSNRCWQGAVLIGVVLDDALLLDYDGNKVAARGSIISLSGLKDELGLTELPQPVQRNDDGDSLHYLFRCPDWLTTDQYVQSNNGGWMPHIDLKWGNQLMILKPHKVVVCGCLPAKHDLKPAPLPLIKACYKGEFKRSRRAFAPAQWDGNESEVDEARAILRYIDPAEDYDDWLDVLMRISDKFGNSDAAADLADEWSGRATNYGGREEVVAKLESFSVDKDDKRPKKSWGALCNRARDNGADLAAIHDLYADEAGVD